MISISRPLRIAASAGLVLLGTAAVVSAQGPDKGQDNGRQPSAQEKGGGAANKEQRGSSGDQQHPGKAQPGAGERPGMERPKGAERQDKDRPKGAEAQDKAQPKGAERQDKDRPKGAERQDKDRPKGAERQDKGQPKDAEHQDKDRPKGAEMQDKAGPKGTRLSDQQRTELGAKLGQTGVERSRVKVSINIGARVPRSVRLHPLPSAVLVSAPDFRGQSYFVQEDGTIVIVDSRSYVIIDVIAPSTTRVAGLRLSPEQMHFVYTAVPRDITADVRVRLALGAEIPDHVELLPLPAEVRSQVPELEGYRFIVAGSDVVIVDPRDRDIALVISE